ncbi:MAG: 1,2-phenylacetyl-CoA epoxidase subunit PaaC [Pseudomonadales bacterium]
MLRDLKIDTTADSQPDQALVAFALGLADDALIHAQRLCEWSGKAPTLEEDLALANVGLDYLGRARMFYAFVSKQTQCSEDQLAYFRDSAEFYNLLIYELPRGDFAFTMLRQYLIDAFELPYFSALAQSAEPELAAIAQKTCKEVQYHLRRSQLWVKRLGLGTVQSHSRAQAALDKLSGYVDELFAASMAEQVLIGSCFTLDRTTLRDAWRDEVSMFLQRCELQLPSDEWRVSGGRQGRHTEHLGHLLGEMQVLQRSYPGLNW